VIVSFLPSSRLAFLLSTLAGAAAAFDPSLGPRWSALACFVLFGLALDDLRPVGTLPASASQPSRIARDLFLATLAGTVLVLLHGWPMLWVVLALGLVQVALFMGPRLEETRLGGPLTVAALGPLVSAGAGLAIVGDFMPQAFWVGLPIGFLADAGRRARTAAHPEPARASAPPWFAGDLVAAFGLVPALVLSAGLPWHALASLLTLPLAAREMALARGTYSWPAAATRMRLLLATFAVLLAAAVFLARLLATRAA
jgi:hypothetical protein